jgi:hypothetical protein
MKPSRSSGLKHQVGLWVISFRYRVFLVSAAQHDLAGVIR